MTSKVDLDRVLGLALRHIRKEYHVDHVWNNVEETLKLRQPCKNENTAGVLGLAPCHKDWEKQCRYKWLIRPLIHRYPPKCHSFVGLDREIGSSAPARSGSCTSIQMLHTHTRKELDHWSDPSGTESRKTLTWPDMIYIYIYRGLRWPPAAT